MKKEKRQPKTKEELEALKKEVAELGKKLAELTEDELKEIGICLRRMNELTDEELEKVSGGIHNYQPGAIAVAVYSYMALVPIIQPPI